MESHNMSFAGSKNFIGFFFLLCLASSLAIRTSPHQRHDVWHSPCTAGHRAHGMDNLFSNQQEEEFNEETIARHQVQLMVELNDTLAYINDLKQEIVEERLHNYEPLVRYCASTSPLLGMPQRQTSRLNIQNFHSTLPYDFQRLATIAVFVHEASTDSHRSYRRRFISLLAHIQKSMCLIEVIALSRGETIQRDVTENVMPAMYKNLYDHARRDRRNCLVVRDAGIVMTDIKKWYSGWV